MQSDQLDKDETLPIRQHNNRYMAMIHHKSSNMINVRLIILQHTAHYSHTIHPNIPALCRW